MRTVSSAISASSFRIKATRMRSPTNAIMYLQHSTTTRSRSLCGQHHRALKLFLQCGKQEVEAAIAVVGKARNDMLTHTLIDFLMGETDGVPKDPNYIYRLYLALGSYSQVSVDVDAELRWILSCKGPI